MKVLNKEELKKAEEALRHFFPQSQQVYGYVFMINRVEADPIDVLVDQWPDFNVLLIRPQRQEKADIFKDMCIFTKDETTLRKILVGTDIIDWKQYLCLSVDLCHEEMLKFEAASRSVPMSKDHVCYMMKLQNPSNLTTERFPVQVSSLNESHVALVNSTWKFGMGEFSEWYIRDMIMNYPSCCVLDSEGQPVSWILTYSNCAMGMGYTLPEHRRKGYSKALVTILAKKLHSEGYPVYCFVEEENQLSYSLLKSLGFIVDLSYRNSWFYFNQLSLTP
ncbi:glycine N-acyltransferase-like protein 3 isoform X2 [Ictalurus furcatus]|nr:glycine N-acyltransferase-like protein 3 isoform X2 [Ictalurus furcatus]XP_053476421.1 glycine N-acyltransferase-like protein 3 isoform X2 [Ictalurus furcatus]XP_053476422.1 glycine N-acyltransferase-like protein 3 isoform X2 [Ictalurus furcatus]XP_053476423.1 glycine N-acyltransferase-like protein 3 isoform X2 [Ictalurus furcatus]